MIRIPLPLLCCLVLVGCASNTEMAEVEPTPPTPAPEVAERSIPEDSLYPLLLAEFALRRKEYGVALSNYMEQAPLLRDTGVSEHATHLAQYLGQEQAALEAARLWVELEPDSPEANNTLANQLARSGRGAAAVPFMAVAARSGNPVNFPLAASDFDQLDPASQAELVTALEGLEEEFGDSEQLQIALAIVYEELDRQNDSLEQLDKVFDQTEFQPQAVLLEAKILQEQGRDDAFERMERALEAEPNNRRLRLQYARLLTRTDIDKARLEFEKLSAQNPRDADLLFSLALINRETGNPLEAKAYLRQMVELDMRADEAHYYLGRMAEDEGNLQEAVRQYAQVTGGRELMNASSRIGRILVSSGQLTEGHGYFNQLRQRHPGRAEQLFALEADLLIKAGRSDLAMEVLNQGLIQLPSSTPLQYTRSMLGEQQNDMALMESDLRAIIAREPDNATALNALGYTLANRTERYGEAEELIERALRLQPGEPSILDSMGWVKYRLGDYPAAVDYLERAYDRMPDPEIAAHLGEVLWVMGRSEDAMAIWRNGLRRDPDHAVLLATLARLGIDITTAANDTLPEE